jgi:DnaK suppressor protein
MGCPARENITVTKFLNTGFAVFTSLGYSEHPVIKDFLHKEAKMLSQRELSKFHNILSERREEIFHSRLQLDESWRTLQKPEVEPEETAKKEKMAQALAQLEEQEKEQVEAIDNALRKLAAGSYGICEGCGEDITLERLEAIFWAVLCVQCAASREQEFQEASAAAIPADIKPPHDYEGMRDDEFEATIYDKLRGDGRVELEELNISCQNSKVFLEGVLPSESKRHVLISIIADDMGLKDIVDNLRIDPLPWQRLDRQQRWQPDRKTEEEILLHGEEVEDMEEGTPVSPPNRFVPEQE